MRQPKPRQPKPRQVHLRQAQNGPFPRARSLVALVAIAMLATITLAAPATAQGGATIEVAPSSGLPGAEIVVQGSGFVDVCGVDLDLIQGDAALDLGFSYTNDDGAFEQTFTVPTAAVGGDARILATGLPSGVEFCFGDPVMTAAAPFLVEDEPGGLIPRFVPEKPTYVAPLGEGFLSTELHLKIRQDADVRLVDGVLNDGLEFSDLSLLLASYPDVDISRLFDARSEDELAAEKRNLEARTGREQGDKNLYFLLTLPESTDEVALLNELNALGIVEIAYPVPRPGVDPALADYEDLQGYRVAAGSGIHADAANTVPGGNGENVQIIDIERFFNPNHEDLPAVAIYPNGDVNAAFNPPYDHGTAVLGEIFALDNDNGMRGLATQASAGFVTTAGGRANAIDIAAANSSPGDVILLELQTGGPNGPCSNATTPGQIGCVPQEFQQASYDAIVSAVAAGIIVVAAAGNGRQNLDDPVYAATLGGRPDSGAIMVGAGAAGSDDSVSGAPGSRNCTNPERGRLVFSNFGSRVNVQGWGQCVATLGYGNIEGSADSNNAYTATFGGTSSASPVVAAAAGILSSIAIANGDADGLNSTEARALLMATGTPQDTSPAALAGNIGPLPNLAAALGLQADVSIAKSADADPLIAGGDVTYTLSVTNNGPNVATDVVVTDALPTEAELVSADAACAEAGPDLVCPLGQLAVGEVVELQITMDVPADLVFEAEAPTVLTNEATVASTLEDPNDLNNTALVDSNVVAVADLVLTSTEALSGPVEALIGQDIIVSVESSVTNGGPSSPMDAELEVVTTPSAGASVSLASDTAFVPALEEGETRMLVQIFSVTCEAPGIQSVDFGVEVSPANAADTDPDPTNNTGADSVSFECITPVVINVRPGNAKNQINLQGNAKVPVGFLTTVPGEYGLPVGFDATQIVADSVRFGNPSEVYNETGGASQHSGVDLIGDSFERDDKTKDGDDDLRLQFPTSGSDLIPADVEACARGQYVDGGATYTFFGCDAVKIK